MDAIIIKPFYTGPRISNLQPSSITCTPSLSCTPSSHLRAPPSLALRAFPPTHVHPLRLLEMLAWKSTSPLPTVLMKNKT